MQIRVLAFATAADVIGKEPVEIDLEAGATVDSLGASLCQQFPALEPIWPRLAVAVDGEVVRGSRTLEADAEVALLPPVSGGSIVRDARP